MSEYTLNSERFSNEFTPHSAVIAYQLDKAAELRQSGSAGDRSMARVWLDAAHRVNDGSERPDRWTDAQARGESWAARYAARQVEASQPVIEVHPEVRAVKGEVVAEQGQSWAARYAAQRIGAGQQVAEARAEMRTVKEEAAAEAPRKARGERVSC